MIEREDKIGLVAYDGVDDLDLIGALSVLAKAEAALGRNILEVAAPRSRVGGASGIVFDLSDRWVDISTAEPGSAIVIAGGPGAPEAADDPGIASYVRRAHAMGVHIYAICTGALLLARYGLLHGRHVAMHHRKQDLLRDAGCASIGQGLVRDDWLTTIGGDEAPSCKSIDLAVQLIRDVAPDVLPVVMTRMEIGTGRRLQEPALA